MALHGLSHVVVGVPDIDPVSQFYRDFGLDDGSSPVRFASADGGQQLRLVTAPTRRVIEIGVRAADPDDISRLRASLSALDVAYESDERSLVVLDRGTGARIRIEVAPTITQVPIVAVSYNAPGHTVRDAARAEGVLRDGPVRPRKLGHVVLGSIDQAYSQRLFVDGLGFKISDSVIGRAAFLRCSTDHHNVLIQNAPAQFLHHTSWQVDDVDEVGRAASLMLDADPSRHVWGLGRHHIGSNFFWYLRDPAGNFAEYYSDLDCIIDDELWKPEIFEGRLGLWRWGPPPPPSFLRPDDLAELMAATHA
jgi:catechol 2,3-dioxygenase-like lactoylglutathione lyase family enzyme